MPRSPHDLSHPGVTPVTMLHRQLGAIPQSSGGTIFTVFAPACQRLWISANNRNYPMQRIGRGYHQLSHPELGPGDRYFIRTPRGKQLPDPASRFQPDGVHGASQVIDPYFHWQASEWQGINREDLVIYEAHVGALTDSGTFRGAIDRLDELADLGVTAIEWMPVATSAGDRNWGYDGVDLFAPMHAYGTPKDFRAFVDAAHRRGIGVILDVVYNHLGPEGNYLRPLGGYLAGKHTTPWGDSLNFDHPPHCEQVRRFVIANAIYWLDEFRLDGLRIDAVHCTRDDSDPHLLTELGRVVNQWAAAAGRNVLLIAESNVYDPEVLPQAGDGAMAFDAMWADDFLYAMLATYRPEMRLSLRDYRPAVDLDQVLRHGYIFCGTRKQAPQRRDSPRPVDREGLIFCIQNHDFVGNHPLGKRFHQVTSLAAQRAAAALLLLSPAIPMLFMGEEFATERPFHFFVDFGDPSLQRRVDRGRRREYPLQDWSTARSSADPENLEHSKIGTVQSGDPSIRRWYKRLLEIRKAWKDGGLLNTPCMVVDSWPRDGLFRLQYRNDDATASVIVNLLGTSTIPADFLGDPDHQLADSRSALWRPPQEQQPQAEPWASIHYQNTSSD